MKELSAKRLAARGSLLAAMVVILASCGWLFERVAGPPPKVRTDAAPLLASLELLPTVATVRWIAVTSHNGNSMLPGVTDGLFIFANISLTQAEWAALYRGAEQSAEIATLKAPEKLWRYILPPEVVAQGRKSGEEWAIAGAAIDARRLLKDDAKVHIHQAARIGDALVMEFFDPD
jgi:hypothetical protein